MLKSSLSGLVTGMAGGYGGGFAAGFIMSGGDLSEAHKAGMNGLVMGGALGLAAGSYTGYKQAKALGIDPWTGKINKTEITKSRFGHTFENHGEDATDFITKRASGSGNSQGQFLDDQAAASFINKNISQTANGTVDIPMPSGFPARIINTDGSYATPTHIRLVPGGNGVKTAYPLIKY